MYAGTGSSKIRSNVSIGRGIYKSADAGKTWSQAGGIPFGMISGRAWVVPTEPWREYIKEIVGRQIAEVEKQFAPVPVNKRAGGTWGEVIGWLPVATPTYYDKK